MSLLSSIKAVGRAIDPTNKSAPLGSLLAKGLDGAATAFGAPPGVVQGQLSNIGATNAAASAAKAAASTPLGSFGASLKSIGTGTWIALAVALGLGVYLLTGRKR